ncbi:hypothetical protein D3C80_1819480 [compost metagenome]
MYQAAEREQHEQRHAQHHMQFKDRRNVRQVVRRAGMESHHRLRPGHQFHHLAAVHMLGGERNGQQTEAYLHHQQRQDHDIGKAAGGAHPRIGQTAFQQ